MRLGILRDDITFDTTPLGIKGAKFWKREFLIKIAIILNLILIYLI